MRPWESGGVDKKSISRDGVQFQLRHVPEGGGGGLGGKGGLENLWNINKGQNLLARIRVENNAEARTLINESADRSNTVMSKLKSKDLSWFESDMIVLITRRRQQQRCHFWKQVCHGCHLYTIFTNKAEILRKFVQK